MRVERKSFDGIAFVVDVRRYHGSSLGFSVMEEDGPEGNPPPCILRRGAASLRSSENSSPRLPPLSGLTDDAQLGTDRSIEMSKPPV